jgi:membrane associated rhomboid family serine protease
MNTIWDDIKMQFRTGDITVRLIFLNVILFILPYIIQGIVGLFTSGFYFMGYVSLSSNPTDLIWKPWSLITYSFFHAGPIHLLFNMLMLNFSGRLFLTFFTQKQLVSVYILGAIFAGLVFMGGFAVLPMLQNINLPMIGASASVMAILFATVTYSPLMQFRLLLFGTVKLWHVAIALLVVDLIQLSVSNTGGHLAHLGGALFGFMYTSQLKSGRDIGGWLADVIDAISGIFSAKKQTHFKKVHRNYNKKPSAQSPRIVRKDKAQQQIDEILEKISRSGYESLSADEKDFLFRAGKT